MKKILLLFVILIILVLNTSIVMASYNSRAFIVGINNEEYVPEAVNTAERYLEKMGYTTDSCIGPEFDYFIGNYGGSITRLASGVVCLIGHGNSQSLYVYQNPNSKNTVNPVNSNAITCARNSGTYITEDGSYHNFINIQDVNFDNSNLVIFAGCNTASGNENIAKKTYEQGAYATLGWDSTVYFVDWQRWLYKFFFVLNSGFTLDEAYAFANAATNYIDQETITKGKLYGWTDRQIKLATSTSTLVANSISRERNFSSLMKSQEILKNTTLTFDNSDIKINNLNTFLEKNYKNFETDKYNLKIFEHGSGNYTLNYTFKIGEFDTNLEYSVAVVNENVIYINDEARDSALPSIDSVKSIQVTETMIEKAKKEAVQKLNLPENANIIQQRIIKFYDCYQNKAYIKVATEYEIGTKELGEINKYLEVYFYEL